ncbi:MAG TPA: VOC family protein [Phototrophicaceae bacterium]|nr:VOC family protein [Phototrophicaceae bacterium]
MFQGLRTVIYNPGDLAKAKAWYTEVLGFGPYFDEPFYVGFNVGGYELGLNPGAPPPSQKTGVVAYWGVANIEQAHQRLLELGATAVDQIEDVGDGIKVATVLDPFGNLVGIIENPHFKLP